MPGFTHVRAPRLWDFERYTDAQATELRQLRDLCTTHLVHVFGPELPDAYALVTEGNLYYPRYTATTLTPPPITPVPPAVALPAPPYQSFADTLIATLAVYEEGRRQRWFGKGHPNDPTRLFGIFLRNICQNWLRHAPSNEATLQRVRALRQYLEALADEQVFTNEGQGHDSMTVLLHNLATPLTLLEKRLRHEISLQSAREHFSEAKNGLSAALNEAARYLFYGLAVKKRTSLPFSLVNMQARVVNKLLAEALETREGLLLKQWIHAPGVTRTLLPQEDRKEAKSVRVRKPMSLFGAETPTPLLDDKGRAHPAWLRFLEQAPETEAQLDASLRKLPSGICPVFSESKAFHAGEGEVSVLAEAIELHGLMESLARYQEYLHQCWQLAGFGGDHCVYDQMTEAVVSILTELQVFNQKLSQRLEHFQERLDLGYKAALDAETHLGWRANYRKAKASQEKLLGLLQGCELALTRVITHAQDPTARSERRALAAKAYQALSHAPDFLNQARQQVGLEPKASYPGLAAPDSRVASNLFGLSLAPERMSIDQVLVILLPQSPHEVAWLSRLRAETPTVPPWRIFRGTHQRYCYLHHNTRLERIGQDLSRLQLNAQTPLTPEKAAFIARLRSQLQEEQGRITQLSQQLWWPFQRASIRFFAALQRGITEKLGYLQQFNITPVPALQGSVSTQRLQRALGPSITALAKATPVPAAPSVAVSSSPLSAETQAKIAHIYRGYNRLTLRERAHFDTWQHRHFRGSLWDARGVLRQGLTEYEGNRILKGWESAILQRVDDIVTAHHLTESQIQTKAQALRSNR